MSTQICESPPASYIYRQPAKGGFERFTTLWRKPESSREAEGFVFLFFFKSCFLNRRGQRTGRSFSSVNWPGQCPLTNSQTQANSNWVASAYHQHPTAVCPSRKGGPGKILSHLPQNKNLKRPQRHHLGGGTVETSRESLAVAHLRVHTQRSVTRGSLGLRKAGPAPAHRGKPGR